VLRSATDRYCRYENPVHKNGDETYLAFLELLYTNRKEANYFVLIGILALLQLSTSNKAVADYLQHLPGPCPRYPTYTGWITEFLCSSQPSTSSEQRDIPAAERTRLLENIAALIDKKENTESDTGDNPQDRMAHHKANNQPY
jgi:hypothetical protein